MSIDFEKYTEKAKDSVNSAQKIAVSMQHQQICPEHILEAMITDKDSIVLTLLSIAKCSISLLKDKLREIMDRNTVVSGSNTQPYLSRESIMCLVQAENLAKKHSDEYIAQDRLLQGMLESKTTEISKIMIESGLTSIALDEAIKEIRKGSSANSSDSEGSFNVLKKYTRNLTDLAREGKIDPVIGRDEEIRRTIQVLSRRIKNNPLLIGEPGVGKTAIIEGLAMRIYSNDVPETLKNKTLLELDMGLVVAGAKYRGEFEERFKAIINEVEKSDGEIVLFIDEIHILMGAGASGGAMDASNLLKPALARGQMHCIGATTLDEYRKHIEKDAAFARRLQTVFVSEPTLEDAITILRGVKEKYELHHGTRITDSAVIAAANLSNRYITDRFLPDKAIDLMDEAASRLKMQIDSKPEKMDNLDRKIMQIQVEIEALKKEEDSGSIKRLETITKELTQYQKELADFTAKWNAEKIKITQIKDLKRQLENAKFQLEQAQRKGDLALAGKLTYEDIPSLKKQIEILEKESDESSSSLIRETVTADDIAGVVAKITGIPVEKMMSGEKEKLLKIEEFLQTKVIGQDHVVEIIANAIRRSRSGLASENRPIGSFLFLGPTGVGKTELTKAIAYFLFNDEKAMLRIDMSEYMEKHSVSRLIGAPPGYVGYDEGGILTESVRRRPYQVVLFDEVEKAHPDVFNLLLQLLDDGRLTDSQGRTVDFSNTIVILTSNLGAKYINNEDAIDIFPTPSIEGGGSEEVTESDNKSSKYEQMKSMIMQEVQQFFRPEFLNRIDEIIFFNRLSKKNIRGIVDIQLNDLYKRLQKQEISITIQEKVKDFLGDKGYDPIFGARPLRRVIQKDLYDKLAEYLLKGSVKSGDKLIVGMKDDKIIIGREKER